MKGPYTITLDDDPEIHRLIARITRLTSLPFARADKLIEKARSYAPVATFVDVNLAHGVSGIDCISHLREAWPSTPIIMITADTDAELIGKALSRGANDFLRKPLDPRELNARLQARLMEASQRENDNRVDIADMQFDKRHRSITFDGKTAVLPPLEAKLLAFFVENFGLPCQKTAIRSYLWGHTNVSDNSLDKRLSELRKAIAEIDAPMRIETLFGGKVRSTLRAEDTEAKEDTEARKDAAASEGTDETNDSGLDGTKKTAS